MSPAPRPSSIFLYEFVSGGGLIDGSTPPEGSLLGEGEAMLSALAADLAAWLGPCIHTLRDARLAPLDLVDCHLHSVTTAQQHRETFCHLAAESDWTIVIAPELDGMLMHWAHQAVSAGGRLLGPGVELIALAADKDRLANHLAAAGVPVPRGQLVPADELVPADFPRPAVLKRNDGAGSCDVRLLSAEAPNPTANLVPSLHDRRLETFQPGTPASVAVLCGPAAPVILPGVEQRLSEDGRFTYDGGRLPIAFNLERRAHRLAEQVIAALPGSVGYLGIDLVLGPDEADDVVIEVNPRLTTSYVGLQHLLQENLAQLIWRTATGHPPATGRACCHQQVDFDALGNITHAVARS